MTTQTRAKSTPKDKFYRRYAAAYVLGIVVEEVPNHSWKDLYPRIYGEDGQASDANLLAAFKQTKAQLKGLPGAKVIEIVGEAQAGKAIPEATTEAPAKPKAGKSTRKAKTKPAPKGKTSDADAIAALYKS